MKGTRGTAALRVGPSGEAGDVYYIHGDQAGSTVLLTDQTGGFVGRAFYDAYGGVIENTIPLTLTSRLYEGRPFDAATDLVYHGAGKYYDPQLGQRLQPNPTGGPPLLPQSLNRYAVPTAGSVVGQAVGGSAGAVLLGELVEELTGAGIGQAIERYAARHTAVDVGKLLLHTRSSAFLRATGLSGRFAPVWSSGVPVGGDAVQEWVGTVTSREMNDILATGADDILLVSFTKTGTEYLDDTLLKQFLRSGKGKFASGLAIDLVIETALLPFQGYWDNPYLTPGQKAGQTVLTFANVGATAVVLLLFPESLLIAVPVAVITNLGLNYIESHVPPFSHFYEEHRNLRPLR